jgi:hypothetical protein
MLRTSVKMSKTSLVCRVRTAILSASLGMDVRKVLISQHQGMGESAPGQILYDQDKREQVALLERVADTGCRAQAVWTACKDERNELIVSPYMKHSHRPGSSGVSLPSDVEIGCFASIR